MRTLCEPLGQPVRIGSVPRPIVLDVDTGVDDACALLFAALHPEVDLLGVTCVSGNAPVDDVVRNTMTALAAAGRDDVPVARGATHPLVEHPRDARHVHGDDGMGDLGWPAPTTRPDPRHAVEMLRDLLLGAAAAADPTALVTLVPLAPLTNIALLLRTYPEATAGLREIVFMGGAAVVGNATASAEFNVFHDPEAAAVVLDAARENDIPVTMYGLDVFYQPTFTAPQASALIAAGRVEGNRALELGGLLVDYQCRRFASDATIGDAGAVVTLVAPETLRCEDLPVRVELAGHWSRGRTIVDQRASSPDRDNDPHGIAPTTVRVALEIDGPAVAALWQRTLERSLR
jgi:pyrimidine-specific ribonucleoside hydrolase